MGALSTTLSRFTLCLCVLNQATGSVRVRREALAAKATFSIGALAIKRQHSLTALPWRPSSARLIEAGN